MRQAHVGNGRVNKPEPRSPRRRVERLTDDDIERALNHATSVREAREKLGGVDARTLEERIRGVPRLVALYEAAKTRGVKTGRANWTGGARG